MHVGWSGMLRMVMLISITGWTGDAPAGFIGTLGLVQGEKDNAGESDFVVGVSFA